MSKTIYHGSSHIITTPVFGEGKKTNDYGLGFYCTEELNLAKEWGVDRDANGYANIYTLDDSGLTTLNLNSPEFTVLHWLAVLLENRVFESPSPLSQEAKAYLLKNFKIPYENYDIITGYRADDSYFAFAQDFLNGTISVRQLRNALHFGNLGTQIVLKSKKAFQSISYCGYEMVEASQWHENKMKNLIICTR